MIEFAMGVFLGILVAIAIRRDERKRIAKANELRFKVVVDADEAMTRLKVLRGLLMEMEESALAAAEAIPDTLTEAQSRSQITFTDGFGNRITVEDGRPLHFEPGRSSYGI